MAEDLMRYDLLAQDALRGVVRAALQRVARTGLPGDHHFYIAFKTRAPGVLISERLLAKYPEEITIVLQHRFWGLDVGDERFVVELTFDDIPEKLFVPYAAITGFFDPSVQFGLQFQTGEATEAVEPGNDDTDDDVPAATEASPGDEKPAGADQAEGTADGEAEPGADVVSLDAFRKK